MTFNIKRSNVMWFNSRSRKYIEDPLVLMNGSPLTKVVIQKYLSIVIDNDFWVDSSYFNFLAYYLYLIGCHQRNLPVAILKLLVQSLLVLSHLHYAVSVWEPS